MWLPGFGPRKCRVGQAETLNPPLSRGAIRCAMAPYLLTPSPARYAWEKVPKGRMRADARSAAEGRPPRATRTLPPAPDGAGPHPARFAPPSPASGRSKAFARNFFLDTRNILCYASPIPSPEGALSRPPGPRGEGAAPAPVGARQAKSPAGQRSRSSRGSPPPPLRHYDRSAQWGLKKCGLETFRRRVGAPVRRTFYCSALSGAPSPLVPSRASVRAADQAWAGGEWSPLDPSPSEGWGPLRRSDLPECPR
jgi:hypothetical protein